MLSGWHPQAATYFDFPIIIHFPFHPPALSIHSLSWSAIRGCIQSRDVLWLQFLSDPRGRSSRIGNHIKRYGASLILLFLPSSPRHSLISLFSSTPWTSNITLSFSLVMFILFHFFFFLCPSLLLLLFWCAQCSCGCFHFIIEHFAIISEPRAPLGWIYAKVMDALCVHHIPFLPISLFSWDANDSLFWCDSQYRRYSKFRNDLRTCTKII